MIGVDDSKYKRGGSHYCRTCGRPHPENVGCPKQQTEGKQNMDLNKCEDVVDRLRNLMSEWCRLEMLMQLNRDALGLADGLTSEEVRALGTMNARLRHEQDKTWGQIRPIVERAVECPPMSLNGYAELAGGTVVYPGRGDNIIYPALKLNGEAGEIAEKVGKMMRDDGGQMTEGRREALVKELGDVLWYVAACAFELDVTLEEVARRNLVKLYDRKERGALQGDGDER